MQGSFGIKGTVTKRLWDANGNPKKIFQANKLWQLIQKYFHVDLKLPILLGNWTYEAVSRNLVTITGKQLAMQQLGGTATTPVTAIALGTGTNTPAPADTTLQAEITTGGAARGAATVTNTTTSTTGDTEQWQKTFNITATFSITEEGLLNNNVSGGILLAHEQFSAISVANGDTLQVVHTVQAI